MATIQGVYVALFGRPADPTGLTYFNSVTKNGADLSGIGDLASTQEYKDRFAGQNNTQIVNSIYQSLFGRDAEAAGLTFFVNALNTGSLNIKNIAIAILDGAQGSDKTTVGNKVAAADLYTKSLDTAPEIGSYQGNAAAAQGRAFLAGVTTTVPTQSAVDAAILSMQAAGAAGNTIALTNAADELSLTKGIVNGTATVFTTNNNDTINAKNGDFANGDKIDGGLGIDTLNVTTNVAIALGDDTLKNVEIIKATSGANAAALSGLDKDAALTQLWAVGSTTNFAASDISLSVSAGLEGTFGNAATNTFTFKDADAASTAKLSLNGAVAQAAVSIANAGTVAITNTGTSKLDALTLADAKTVTVAGDGTLTTTIVSAANLSSVDASSFSGKFTIDASANNGLKTFKGGTGADYITLDTLHTNDQTVTTGAGADVITVNGSQKVTTDGTGAVTAIAADNSAKAIVLTGGDGADIFSFGGVGASVKVGDTGFANNLAAASTASTGAVSNVNSVATVADLVKSLITVSDFNKSADIIKVSDGVTSGGGQQALTDAAKNAISVQTDLLAAVSKAAEFTAVNKVAVFDYGTGADAATYVFVNSGTAAFEAGDTLIKVVGATAADFSATNFAVL